MASPARKGASTKVALVALLIAVLLPHGYAAPALAQVTTPAGGKSVSWTGEYSVTQHHLPNSNAEPWVITTAANGQVWFLEQKADILAMYDPANGSFQQHPIPTPGSTPDGVAVDQQGNVWFSELRTNKLGELPAGSGTITEHDVPPLIVSLGATSQTVGCGPGAIVPDPSGSIWVACLFSNQIDEYFPAQGTFSTFNLPIFYSSPAGMVLDGKGDLWFTAANAYMLGKAVISQLVNGTSDGITEFAPLNATYRFKHPLTTSFFGTTKTITTSLPYPSGIVVDSHGNFWITEHVDSSFDRYNPATRSLVRYWTSQTNDAHGYSVSFPNGIAIDANGTVWVGEHYGNNVAEFFPSTETMIEYPVPCCKSIISGLYSLSLKPGGGVWFVEINGDAIGELVRNPAPLRLSLTLPSNRFTLGSHGSVAIPLDYAESGTSRNSTNLSFELSGTSATGALNESAGTFAPPQLSLSPGKSSASTLTLQTKGLGSGIYYITLSATSSSDGLIYSTVLKLTVTGGGVLPSEDLILLAVGIAVAAAGAGLLLARRARPGAGARRPRRNSLKRTSARTAAPATTPAYTP